MCGRGTKLSTHLNRGHNSSSLSFAQVTFSTSVLGLCLSDIGLRYKKAGPSVNSLEKDAPSKFGHG